MSKPYDEPMFQCGFCGEYFIREEMVDGEHYCKGCYDELQKKGEI